MKKLLPLMALLVLTACGCCKTMDPITFAEIQCGDPICNIVDCAGCPYEICNGCDGEQQYVFLTREHLSRLAKKHTRYVITVCDGVVVDKCVSDEEYQRMFFIDRSSTFNEWNPSTR